MLWGQAIFPGRATLFGASLVQFSFLEPLLEVLALVLSQQVNWPLAGLLPAQTLRIWTRMVWVRNSHPVCSRRARWRQRQEE